MSTVRGQSLSLPEQVALAAQAGYHGIEPWIPQIREFVDGGGKLADLRRQIDDSGLVVESAIAFARWIVDDSAQRAAALEEAARDMEMIQAIGGQRIAAPPTGATAPIDLDAIAHRYHSLLEVGAGIGVVPQLELWGHSPAIHRLGQLAYVAAEAGHRDACLLPDVYHIYKGGSSFDGLRLIEGRRIQVFHINDYPADPPRETIADQDRVYPGDGVAPIGQILRDLSANGFDGALSLELFNRNYWQQNALQVATTGLAKMKQVVEAALSAVQ